MCHGPRGLFDAPRRCKADNKAGMNEAVMHGAPRRTPPGFGAEGANKVDTEDSAAVRMPSTPRDGGLRAGRPEDLCSAHPASDRPFSPSLWSVHDLYPLAVPSGSGRWSLVWLCRVSIQWILLADPHPATCCCRRRRLPRLVLPFLPDGCGCYRP